MLYRFENTKRGRDMKMILGTLIILLTSTSAWASDYPPETLIGYIRDYKLMTFQVFSGGCTKKEDFKLEVNNQRETTYVTLYRLYPDYCKAFIPFGTYVSFTYTELGISNRQQLRVTNPLNPGFIF